MFLIENCLKWQGLEWECERFSVSNKEEKKVKDQVLFLSLFTVIIYFEISISNNYGQKEWNYQD